jgi:hypothetical protein
MVKNLKKSNKSGKKKSASKSKTPKRSSAPSAYEEVQERDLHLGSQRNSPERVGQPDLAERVGQPDLAALSDGQPSVSSSRQASPPPANGNESDSSFCSQAFEVASQSSDKSSRRALSGQGRRAENVPASDGSSSDSSSSSDSDCKIISPLPQQPSGRSQNVTNSG